MKKSEFLYCNVFESYKFKIKNYIGMTMIL